ncbi:A/G-specific adenine glycosylase [Lederbergia sp. NSJ-179]|uniref:A/G-specific adenine glycosylase n=1 Tax=Lederbergia sp. NSJ-179 TaxID=2931402 RepID=UPI001FD3703E|nr:A/G-specific adenine glycosylase [Lederbergia sp. NSJ-179]MCJ7843323.1 A/G-specific adenine glycosylase [Lederbergia sp. NSJ-179]
MKDSTFNPSDCDIQQFREDLLNWFIHEQRDLPWRKDNHPYKVWVSEIMLQQTRVDTVIPYFERFMEEFPTMEAFAAADDESVLKIWEGLGYYSRVRHLHSAVKEVVEHYGGKVPDTQREISKLKGVGPYTAGAILSIAYGKPEPAVDGNVMRVLSRILLIEEDIAKPATRKVFEASVRTLIDPNNPSYFNQALMELGALVCTPTSPACLLCPVREHCQAFANGKEQELPVKSRKTSVRHVTLLTAVLKSADNRYLICKRPSEGLLANLWEFPTVEAGNWQYSTQRNLLSHHLQDQYQTTIHLETGSFTHVDHTFSHLKWSMDVFAGEINGPVDLQAGSLLVTREELETFAFPVPHQKIWKAYKEKYFSDRER